MRCLRGRFGSRTGPGPTRTCPGRHGLPEEHTAPPGTVAHTRAGTPGPTARDLNTRVQSFPDMLFAGPLGIGQEEYYKDEDPTIQAAPQVDSNPAA